MTIRRKLTLVISGLLTILFLFASTMILFMDATFRKTEFKKRLEEKALNSVKLLIDVKEVDKNLLKIIDKNTVHKLFNEKTLIFDGKHQLIYASLDDTKIHWNKKDLHYLSKHGFFFREEENTEILGIYYKTKGKDYYVLTSATDKYGKRQVEFLSISLIITFIILTMIGWLITIYMVRKGLKPLDIFHSKISKINENNLDVRIDTDKGSNNEIDLLGNEFNLMLNRIEQAYQKQREFTSNASHELKTPIARIISQLENIFTNAPENVRDKIMRVIDSAENLNELIQSLLLLTKLENRTNNMQILIRIDTVMDKTIERICKQHPDFKIYFSINLREDHYNLLSINTDPKLIEIVFVNLFRNAYLYSANKTLHIELFEHANKLKIHFINDGTTLSASEQKLIFDPFYRGPNAHNNNGLGLGLRICERILTQFHYKIVYILVDNKNCFEITF